MRFERKCPKCKKLLTIDFFDDDEGEFYCSDCMIYLDDKGHIFMYVDEIGILHTDIENWKKMNLYIKVKN